MARQQGKIVQHSWPTNSSYKAFNHKHLDVCTLLHSLTTLLRCICDRYHRFVQITVKLTSTVIGKSQMKSSIKSQTVAQKGDLNQKLGRKKVPVLCPYQTMFTLSLGNASIVSCGFCSQWLVCHIQTTWALIFILQLIFTARRYASAVLAVIVCPSVCHKSELYKDG